MCLQYAFSSETKNTEEKLNFNTHMAIALAYTNLQWSFGQWYSKGGVVLVEAGDKVGQTLHVVAVEAVVVHLVLTQTEIKLILVIRQNLDCLEAFTNLHRT